MEFDLNKTLEQIKSHPLFIKLKDVVENIDGWHDKENVYDHLIKTEKYALEFSTGNFIKNEVAKEQFLLWMNDDFHGIKRKDIAVISALIHDCGKILYFEENGISQTINTKTGSGQTSCPGHEYWGGKLVVPELLSNAQISFEAKHRISQVVKLHGELSLNYFLQKKDFSIEQIIADVKSRVNGCYKDVLFNQFVDCYDAPAFSKYLEKIEKMFNEPSFYTPRKYLIP